jgi:hypothetical protein
MTYTQGWANSIWKRFVLAALLCGHGNITALAHSQGAHFSKSDACIALPTANRTSRTWKHGEPEQRDYIRASTTKDSKARIESLTEFLTRYPDSDYDDVALLIKLGAEDEIHDWEALAADSRKLLRSPTLDHLTLLIGGYMQLAEALFHINADEAAVRTKVDEVGWTVRCGREALQRRRILSGNSERVDPAASGAGSTFAMAQAQASLLANDEATALRESSAALQMKPADPRSNFLFALAMLQRESPDFQEGIFYLARASSLSPSDDGLKTSVGELYKAYHGSSKGLDKVMQAAGASASEPRGFWIEPQHPKEHTAAKTAVGLAIAALLGYAIAKSPEATIQTLADLGQDATPNSKAASARMLVFGGEDHKTYLGCLSCPKGAADSVLTPGGDHGPPNEGIWDKASFGSPASQYSACSVFASEPPVIADEDGTYLGRLTLNRNHSQIGLGARFYDWLHDSVCN